MTSLTDRPGTALLVVDVQNDVVAGAHDRDRVVANIAVLVERARAHHVPVIWVQHSADNLASGSPGWQYVSELELRACEPVVHKLYGDAFEGTDLESLLADQAVGRLVVAGAQTDACIRSTLHGALVRGYDATLVADAHTTDDLREYGSGAAPEQVIAHTNLYWKWSVAPGRKGDVVPTAEIDFDPSPPPPD